MESQMSSAKPEWMSPQANGGCQLPAILRRLRHHLSVRWTALFREESLLQRQLHILGIESTGFQQRRSRYPINPSCGFAAALL